MIKKTLIVLGLFLTFSSLLMGCNNNKPYEIEKMEKIEKIEETSTQDENNNINKEKKDKELEQILKNSEKTIDISKDLNKTDMSNMLLIDYSEKKYVKFDEIVNQKKPTVIIVSSPYCSACSNINYTEFLNLKNKANIVIAFPKSQEDETIINEKGLLNDIYLIDTDMIVDTFIEDTTFESKYIQLISMGLPSCVFINSDMTFEFGAIGIKYANEVLDYLKYLE